MPDFNPAAFVTQGPDPQAFSQQVQHITDRTNESLSNAYAVREDNKRNDERREDDRRKEERHNQEFDASHGLAQGYLGIAQSQEARAGQKAENDRRRLQANTAFDAFSKAESADEINTTAQMLGYSEGIGFRPAPHLAGSATKPGENSPQAAPPVPGETVGDAASRVEQGALSMPEPPGGQVPGRVYAPPPDDTLTTTVGKPPLVSDVIDGNVMVADGLEQPADAIPEFNAQQIQDTLDQFTNSSVVPNSAIDAQASQQHNDAVSASFQQRSRQIQSMNLPPEVAQLALGMAASSHGMPGAPPPQMGSQPGMPPPPGGMMHQQQPMIDPHLAALAGAPPQTPVNVANDMRIHGGLEAYDLKTGQPIFGMDALAIKQARRDRMRQGFEPLIKSIQDPRDRKLAAGAMDSYINTGDSTSKEILHWIFQKQGQEARGSSASDIAMQRLALAKRAGQRADEKQAENTLLHVNTEVNNVAAKFNKQYNVIGLNKDIESLGKSSELISSDSSMSQRVALAQLVTSIFGKMASNSERENITTAGLQSKVDEVLNFLGGTAELTPQQISMVKGLNNTMKNHNNRLRGVLAKHLERQVKTSAAVRNLGGIISLTDDHYQDYADSAVSQLFEGNIDPASQRESVAPDADEADTADEDLDDLEP